MNRRYAIWARNTIVGVLAMLAMTAVFSTKSIAQVNRPELPTLSLTGAMSGWNNNIYPDGRIWVPRRGVNGERILTVPVFVRNCWRNTPTFTAFPIYSFKMKMQFDSTALEFIGIEKNGPPVAPGLLPKPALARDFEFSADVARDTTYQSVIGAPLDNRLRGKRVMISAISAKPLPQTGDPTANCESRPFVEMFYVKFRVVANPANNPVSARTPIIITNDTLFYNDFAVGQEAILPNDPPPSRFAGLGGVDNFFFDINGIEQNRDVPRYSRPGMIWVEVTDEIPKLSFTNVADRRLRLVDSVDGSNGASWFVTQPITVDSGLASGDRFVDDVNGIGTRDIDVINATAGSRATNITVTSDEAWLLFRTFRRGGGSGEIDPIPTPSREGFIPVLDKGILGTVLGSTPQGDPTELQRDVAFRIICDPQRLPLNENREVTGIYTGNITFESASLDITPVKIRVTFIYFRPPFEPSEFEEGWERRGPVPTGRGIQLEVRNSNNPVERTYLVMGVGARATDRADTLFGETIWESPLNSFGARWYPMNRQGNDIYPNGLRDMWARTGQGQVAASRDIRDIYSDSTLIFKCRFNAGSALNYPVVVSWNTDDFTPGSELFIRDTLNGARFNVNMRNATNIGGSRYSYTIQDADINAFIIEYTLPKVATFPDIKKGWNLLSMPVNPSDARYRSVFVNGLNKPVVFTQNTYQQEEILRPGVGYFVKFPSDEKVIISGARIRRIDNVTFPVRLFEGWNTIGSLSTPVATEDINLLPFSAGQFPTIEGDIYRYVTDRGYQPVSEIQPGYGYWIKVSGQAYLQMFAKSKAGVDFAQIRQDVTSRSTTVQISDNAAKVGVLYIAPSIEHRSIFELPPLPPNELFDVRFSNNSYVEDVASPIIRLQGVSFPATLSINNTSASYDVVNAVTGQRLGTIGAFGNNSVVINDPSATAIRLNNLDMAGNGLTVSPNPVSSTAIIGYAVTEVGNVSVQVFNSVGEAVQTLVNEIKNAGQYIVDLSTVGLPSGSYIVKVTNGRNVTTTNVTVVR